jgi:hypothetical protein
VASTPAWETAVQRLTWTGGHRRGEGGGVLMIGVERGGGEKGGDRARSVSKRRGGGAEKSSGCGATWRGLGRGPAQRRRRQC